MDEGDDGTVADLLSRPLLRRDEPAWGSRVPWLAGIVAAGWALIAGFAMSVLPAVAIWIGNGAEAALSDPLRFGARLWMVAHGTGLDVDGSRFSVAPLGLTIVFVLLIYRSARWAAHSAGVASTRGALPVLLPAVATYALGAGVVAGVSATPGVAALPLEAVVWAAGWSAASVTIGVALEAGLFERWLTRIPAPVRTAVAGGAAAVAGLVLAGAVLAVVSAIVHSDRIGALAEALDAGVLGGAVLAVGSALVMPNVVVWGATFALGPGFAVGASTSVAPDGVQLGPVPAVPVLGALPPDVPGVVGWLTLIGPLLAGGMAGFVVYRGIQPIGDEPPRLTTVLSVVGGAAISAGAAMAALVFVSGGSAGADRLSEIGPVPWQAAMATVAFVSIPAAAVVVVLRTARPGAGTTEDTTADGAPPVPPPPAPERETSTD